MSFSVTKLLGEGSYGKVYSGFTPNGNPSALKTGNPEDILRELSIVNYINKHPETNHIIASTGIFKCRTVTKTQIGIGLTLCDMALIDHLKRQDSTFSLKQIQRISRQLVEACYYLDQIGIIHADIKPGNILISRDATSIKLADFGLSFFKDVSYEFRGTFQTLWYRSPDVILEIDLPHKNAKHLTSAMDIWSVGCVIGEIYSKRPLFHKGTEEELITQHQVRLQKYYPPSLLDRASTSGKEKYKKRQSILPDTMSSNLNTYIIESSKLKKEDSEVFQEKLASLIDLLNQTLEYFPERRITAGNLLYHPFFTSPIISETPSCELEESLEVDPLPCFFPIKLLKNHPTNVVYESVDKRGTHYALKIGTSSKTKDLILKEGAILDYLHKNGKIDSIVYSKGLFPCLVNGKREIGLVFDLEKSNLLTCLLTTEYGFTLDKTQKLAKDISEALFHLKKKGIVHGNISLNSILISSDETSFKVGGLTRSFFQGISSDEQRQVDYPKCKAPEMILEIDGYIDNYPIDVWSAACIIYSSYVRKDLFTKEDTRLIKDHEAFLGRPYPDDLIQKGSKSKIQDHNKSSYHARHPFFVDKIIDTAHLKNETDENSGGKLSLFIDFLDKLFSYDPVDRLTPEQMLEHPFLIESSLESYPPKPPRLLLPPENWGDSHTI